MSPTCDVTEVENEQLLQKTSESTNFSYETASQIKFDDSNLHEITKKTRLEKEKDNSSNIKAAGTQTNDERNESVSEKEEMKTEARRLTGDVVYRYHLNTNSNTPSSEQYPPFTYPIPYPFIYTSYNGLGSAGVVSTTTSLNGIENDDCIQSTKNDSKSPHTLTTNYISMNNCDRNGLTAILDAVHQRERLSMPLTTNAADSCSLGRESSESCTKLQEDSMPPTQQSNESSSLHRSSHASSKQRSDEGIATPFLRKLYRLVSDPKTEDLCSWTASGRSFVIWNPTAFARDVLPNYFKHNNLSSFVRQLNQYGFHKMHPDAWEFGHARFIRGREDLVATIERRPSRPGKMRRNDRDDESTASPLLKRPKTECLRSIDTLEKAGSQAGMRTTMESVDSEHSSPYGHHNSGDSVVSSGATFWQSYQPFVLNNSNYNAFKNGMETMNGNSSSSRHCNPLYTSSSSLGTLPWISTTGMPTTDLEKRICMIEQALAQLYYTVHKLCQDRDSLRHDNLSTQAE